MAVADFWEHSKGSGGGHFCFSLSEIYGISFIGLNELFIGEKRSLKLEGGAKNSVNSIAMIATIPLNQLKKVTKYKLNVLTFMVRFVDRIHA